MKGQIVCSQQCYYYQCRLKNSTSSVCS